MDNKNKLVDIVGLIFDVYMIYILLEYNSTHPHNVFYYLNILWASLFITAILETIFDKEE